MENEIREQVARFLLGELSRAGLQEWLVASTWDIDEATDQEAAVLGNAVLLALVERSQGDRTEAELRRLLRASLETSHLGNVGHDTTGSAASTHRARWVFSRLAAADRRFEVAFG